MRHLTLGMGAVGLGWLLLAGCIESTIQRQEAEIDALEARLQLVQQDLSHLEAEMDRMEADIAKLHKVCEVLKEPD